MLAGDVERAIREAEAALSEGVSVKGQDNARGENARGDGVRRLVAAAQAAMRSRACLLPNALAASFEARLSRLQNELASNFSVPGDALAAAAPVYCTRAACDTAPLPDLKSSALAIADVHSETLVHTAVSHSVVVENVSDSQITLGPCSGAVFLRNVRRSIVRLSASQLRLFNCASLRIFCTVVASRPVLEDCSDIDIATDPMLHTAAMLSSAGLCGAVDRSGSPIDFSGSV